MNAITVTLEGGVIQDISNIPKGIKIVVKDYDTDGVEFSQLQTDSNGDSYIESVWEDS